MKQIALFFLTIALVFTVFTATCRAETKVYQVSTIKGGVDTYPVINTVLKIVDTDNDIVCFAMASNSKLGRDTDGGYPMNSITCVRVEKAK